MLYIESIVKELIEEPIAKKPRPDRRTCPHCCHSVSFKTYKIHQRLFYNPALDVWSKSRLFVDDADSASSTANEDSNSSVDLNDLIHQEHSALSRDVSPLHNLSTYEGVEEMSEKESVPSSIDGKILNVPKIS